PSVAYYLSIHSLPSSPPPPPLHSFPTRRSSDLAESIRESGFAPDQLGAEHIAIEGVGARPVRDVDHAVIELGRQRHSSHPTPSIDRKSTRLNSSHVAISYAVFCLKKKKKKQQLT